MGITQRLGTIPLAISTDTSNNVGIGGSPSGSYKLEVTGTGAFSSSVFAASTMSLSNDGTYGINYKTLGFGGASNGSNRIFAGSSTNDGLYICAATGVGIQFRVNGNATDVLGISSTGVAGFTGRVSIGNGLSSGYFSVTNATSGISASFSDNVNNTLEIRHNSTGSTIDCNTNLLFSTASTERMRITTGGIVYIGLTNPPDSGTLFNVIGTNTSGAMSRFYLSAASTTARSAIRVDKYDNNSTTSQVYIDFTISQQTTACGSITANGANQATFTAWSDRRLKENITELTPQLENILALKPSEFDYKDGSGHQIGFIAQEMQEVFPDSVGENAEGFLTVAGWNKTEAILVKAIQELSAQNQDLKSRLDKAGL